MSSSAVISSVHTGTPRDGMLLSVLQATLQLTVLPDTAPSSDFHSKECGTAHTPYMKYGDNVHTHMHAHMHAHTHTHTHTHTPA